MKKLKRKTNRYVKEPKTKVIGVRVNFEELEKIDHNAKRAGMDRSTYMRACSCNYKIKEKADRKFYETLKDVRKLELQVRKINENQFTKDEIDIHKLSQDISKMIFECYKTFS